MEGDGDNSVPLEADISEASKMTINDLDARMQRMEAMVSEHDARLKQTKTMASDMQDVIATMQENNASVGVKKEEKITSSNTVRGFLRSSFKLDKDDMEPATEEIKIAGATFYLNAFKHVSSDGKTPCLSIYLSCEPDLDTVSYDVDYTICVLGSSSIQLPDSGNICFDKPFADICCSSFINKDYDLKHTNVALDVEFLNSSLVNSDCTLLVEGQRFTISKGLLVTYSNYFKTLFLGPFTEKVQDEVKLEGVIAAEFAVLLKAIYIPVSNKNALFVGKNCECLLRLADYFQVRLITKRCSNYLKSCPTSKIAMGEKLQLAQDYNLMDVMDLCVGQCKTMADLTAIFQSSVYSLLDSETKLRVYENVTKVNCTT
uniref:BTB domain-containing protein n=1 Tax=Ditylenchus dipsaci TaxID=166011 RepID=A0A915CZR8_9BILA